MSEKTWKGGGSPGRTRTCDQSVNSRSLYQLSYRGTRSITDSGLIVHNPHRRDPFLSSLAPSDPAFVLVNVFRRRFIATDPGIVPCPGHVDVPAVPQRVGVLGDLLDLGGILAQGLQLFHVHLEGLVDTGHGFLDFLDRLSDGVIHDATFLDSLIIQPHDARAMGLFDKTSEDSH